MMSRKRSKPSEAEIKLRNAHKHIRGLIRAISAIVVDEVPGSEDLLGYYVDKLKTRLPELIEMRDSMFND